MPNLLFVAGDLSGDIHAAMLARRVLELNPGWKIYALGGPHLREAGAHLVGDTSGCSVIGLVSSLQLVPRVLKLRRRVLEFLSRERVDAAVLCDWGAFNGRLLPQLHAANIPVLYYFPPRSWQRSGQRGLSIAPFVSRVATPFEWSAQRLNEAGCRAEWVGHPLLETVQLLPQDAPQRLALRREFDVPDDAKLVALLPGSRALELRYIAPSVAGAVSLLRRNFENLHFAAAVPRGAATSTRKKFPSEVSIIEGRAAQLLSACDAAIVKSGTSTLEAAVADAPQVVVYDGPKVMRLQAHIMGVRKRVPFVAMPNIIVQRRIVPELLGEDCTPANIAREVSSLLEAGEASTRMRADYALVRRALGAELPIGATQRTAEILEEMLEEANAARFCTSRPATEQAAAQTS
jgi:lipid-A-disaccharide synthase